MNDAAAIAASDRRVSRRSSPVLLSLVEQAQTCLVQPLRTGCCAVLNGFKFAWCSPAHDTCVVAISIMLRCVVLLQIMHLCMMHMPYMPER